MVRNGEKSPERGCVTNGQCAQGALSTKFRHTSRLQGRSEVDIASPTFSTGASLYGSFVSLWEHSIIVEC